MYVDTALVQHATCQDGIQRGLRGLSSVSSGAGLTLYPTVLYAWRRGPLYCTVLGYATVLQWAAGASLEHIDLASPAQSRPVIWARH